MSTMSPTLGLLPQGWPCAVQGTLSPIGGFPRYNTYLHSNEYIVDQEHSYINPTYLNYWPTSNYHLNYNHCAQYQILMNNQVQYYVPMNMKMIPQYYATEYKNQEFDFFVVIDFEATCDKERVPQPQEIIEFPSVIVSSQTGQLESYWQTYVRPTCNPELTDFCKDLTGIQQVQVDNGVSLSEALIRHDKWLENRGVKNGKFAIVTWGDWDCRVMLESECRFKKIQKPAYFNQWINLRVPFQEMFGKPKPRNLKEAVEKAGMEWEGRAHSGLDDAKNTARLLALLLQNGCIFSLTNSLSNQPQDNPSDVLKQAPGLPVSTYDTNNQPRVLNDHAAGFSSQRSSF